MSTKAKLLGILLVAVAAAIGGGIYGATDFFATRSESAAGACAEHGIERCPFCDPALLESMGFCKEHGVPEAICSRCRRISRLTTMLSKNAATPKKIIGIDGDESTEDQFNHRTPPHGSWTNA